MSQTQLSFRKPGQESPGRGDPPRGPVVLTVTQLVKGANRLLELRFPKLCVEGEVSNLRVVGSGHAYFTLKDDASSLPVTMWRSNVERLRFELRDGLAVRVHGGLGIFVKSGRFQMYAERAEPAGMGAMMQQLEALKRALEAEGLFAQALKRPLPRWPRRIGVVTSAHGAAVHDILKVARRRCPSRILLAPAVVQGAGAARTVVRGIERLCGFEDVDVIIVGRGGGSVEDLWAFNDEGLARTIARCPVPVVSAVGHEVDVSLSDLVADVRAATPSHAAELVVPDRLAFERALEGLQRRLTRSIERVALDARARLDADRGRLSAAGVRVAGPGRVRLQALGRRLDAVHPRAKLRADAQRLNSLQTGLRRVGTGLAAPARGRWAAVSAELRRQATRLSAPARQRLDTASARLQRAGRALGARGRLRLARSVAALQALSPLAVLARGYAVVSDADGAALTAAASVTVGDAVAVRLCEGRLHARVTGVEP